MAKVRSSTRVMLAAVGLCGVISFAWFAGRVTGVAPDLAPDIRPHQTVPLHDRLVGSMDVSPDGTMLATTSWRDEYTTKVVDGKEVHVGTITGTVSLWRVSDWTPVHTLTVGYPPDVEFSADGKVLAILLAHEAEFRRVDDWSLEHSVSLGTGNWIEAISPDGQTLVSGWASNSTNGVAKLWSARDGKLLQTLSGHTDTVYGAAFSPDGQTVATTSYDETARLWRVSDGSLLHVLKGHEFWVGRAAFSPDGRTLATGSDDGSVRLWQVEDGALLHTLVLGIVQDVEFSPDGQFIAAGSAYDWARLWRVSDGTLIADLANEEDQYGSGGKVLDVAFARDGSQVFGGTLEGTVRVWDLPKPGR
ncbi:MAG: WD40 repeat domain-containing protein [Chloroflexota bacterium]|nr:WD40 repeat domain-containing protein [Chloroflexota bacterium]